MFKLIILVILLTITNTAHAYLGPGMSGGILIATIGVVVAVFAALFGVLWFPIKRMLKKRNDKEKSSKSNE